MSQYEPLLELLFFAPTRSSTKLIQSRLVAQIVNSRITHWSMYLGARILQLLLRDGHQASVGQFIPWLERFDRLCVISDNDRTLDDLVDRLTSGLEVSYLKFITLNINSAYSLLRRLAPTFMQIAFADPTLWPRQPTSNGISLAHTLASPQLELGRYVFMEAVSSLMFGTPPLVEYDTSHPLIQTQEALVLEWVHGCATEFVMAIVKINIWRARDSNYVSGSDSGWRDIEESVWAWCPKGGHEPNGDSQKLVAKLAVQEAWRHAVLIYLYMGMCGVTSHDPRVESSTRQIDQLLSVVEHSIGTGVHLVVPLLVGAIATPSEIQRGRFRDAITKSAGNRAWITSGVGLVSVVDHLWHTAAVDGAPVTWDDYIKSRKARLRID
ncbi:hypothetical protein FRC08_003820 [Ceratobasidium sp. 394]|nr:hypothetical protein FRC08_003820 [Ceratobasidium sp. 394]